jgi:hypothetical protein
VDTDQRVADAGDGDRSVFLDDVLGPPGLVCSQGAHGAIVRVAQNASCQPAFAARARLFGVLGGHTGQPTLGR